MLIPNVSYDPGHLRDKGANAPNGRIKMLLACAPADCPAGSYRVDVIEASTGAVIASGAVRCTGRDEQHELPMQGKRALAAVRVKLRYTCGTTVEDDPFPSMIFVVSA